MARSVTTTEARSDFLELLTQVADGKQRVKITRRDKVIAAFVPIEDLERIEALETEADQQQAKRVIDRIRSGKEKTTSIFKTS